MLARASSHSSQPSSALCRKTSGLITIRDRVQLKQRQVRPDELGKPLAAIAIAHGVCLYRNGQPYSFAEVQTLLARDTVVEIVTD